MRTIRRSRNRTLLASLALAATLMSASPAMAGSSTPRPPGPGQSVDATFTAVSAPGPCILVGGPTAVDFGQSALGAGFVASTATTTVASCSMIVQDVRATVSDATAAGSPTASLWAPHDCPNAECITPVDRFAYRLGGVTLIDAPRSLVLGGPLVHELRLPAPGSSGAGEVITMRVTILAVAS